MPRLSLTTWSLHALLTDEAEPLRLVDVPARIREAGVDTLEICHFHFPDTAAATLDQLRAALDDAGVELFSILIDMGDISRADEASRETDIRAIKGWIDVAARLKAKVVRVVAGEGKPDDAESLDRSIDALRQLSNYAAKRGVRVLTENFKPLASTAANCHRILDALEGEVGLCADIGNFPIGRRIEEFRAVAPRAESVHVKASYDGQGRPDTDELRQCLDATKEARFDGPYTLVYDRGGDIWHGISRLREIVTPYTGAYR